MTSFNKWDPLEGIPNRLYVEGLHDDYEGFRILLKGEKITDRLLRVYFDAPLAYRSSSECENSLNLFDPGNGCFYTSQDSDFHKWFNVESSDIYSDILVTHYVFLAANSIIDVLSIDEPKIRWL